MDEYRAVGNRCAIDITSLDVPISTEEALAILRGEGFQSIDVDIMVLARSCIGTSEYRRAARLYEAPSIVDCSSFVKWLYGRRGIWLPRRSIQQWKMGGAVLPKCICAGDAVFVSGLIDYYFDDPSSGVGHVGIATGVGTVIHAASKMKGVIESPLAEFIAPPKFRGVRRYIPEGHTVLTLRTPPEREVETADDIKWIVRQFLPAHPR